MVAPIPVVAAATIIGFFLRNKFTRLRLEIMSTNLQGNLKIEFVDLGSPTPLGHEC